MPNVAMIADNLNLNGISTVIVNYSNELSDHGYNVLVFAGDKIDDSFYNKEKYHFTIIRLPKRKKNPIKYYTELYISPLFITCFHRMRVSFKPLARAVRT